MWLHVILAHRKSIIKLDVILWMNNFDKKLMIKNINQLMIKK